MESNPLIHHPAYFFEIYIKGSIRISRKEGNNKRQNKIKVHHSFKKSSNKGYENELELSNGKPYVIALTKAEWPRVIGMVQEKFKPKQRGIGKTR